MSELRNAAQQVLEVLKNLQGGCTGSGDGTVEAITVWCPEVIEALEQALAEPEQEPVAWQWLNTANFRKKVPADATPEHWRPLYAAPTPRKPLDISEVLDLLPPEVPANYDGELIALVRMVEAAHGITGEGA